MFEPFQYRAIVTKVKWKLRELVHEKSVLDGDSAYFLYDEGERKYANPNNRFFGVDTPEMRGRHSKFWIDDPRADEIAIEAKEFVRDLIEGKEVFCRSMGLDKYGRRLPLIWVTRELANTEDPHETLNQLLIDKGLAKHVYDRKNILGDIGWRLKTINVNGKDHKVGWLTASYEEVLKLSGLSGADLYTVAYSNTPLPSRANGVMAPGEVVHVQEGTRFDVAFTGNA